MSPETPEVKSLDAPDERRSFNHGEVDIATLPGATFGRALFNPGWRWSVDVKPTAGTASCQAAHLGYVISGRMHVRMDDGTEADLGPGDAHVVPPGHDAWVVGDEQLVVLDITPGSPTARAVRCPCGVEFRVESDGHLDELVAAVQEHAAGSHGQQIGREDVLADLAPARV